MTIVHPDTALRYFLKMQLRVPDLSVGMTESTVRAAEIRGRKKSNVKTIAI
jgi:hypothetical protein